MQLIAYASMDTLPSFNTPEQQQQHNEAGDEDIVCKSVHSGMLFQRNADAFESFSVSCQYSLGGMALLLVHENRNTDLVKPFLADCLELTLKVSTPIDAYVVFF